MYHSERNIAILVNPLPGKEKACAVSESLDVLLMGMSVQHRIFDQQWPGRLDDFTDAWIVGGDGTVNYFINQYPETKLNLSIFPGGTGNDFHWMLYDKMDLEEQVEKILTVSPKLVDAGICNGRLFINGIGIGFDGAIVKDLLGKKKRPGKTSYLISILKHIIRYREFSCEIEVNKRKFQNDCFMISVANARRYGGGFHVAPVAQLDDGLLDVSIVGKISPLKRLLYLPVIEKGKHLDLPFISYKHSEKIHIRTSIEMHAHADGEYFSTKDFQIEILPGRFSFLF